MTPLTSVGTQRPTRFRYVVIAVLLAVTVMNFADRGALAFASAQIIAEFHFDRASWGAILGFFGYGYMAGGLIAGLLADRWGAKRVWIVAGVAWSGFEAATALAGEVGLGILGGSALLGFAMVRILFGVSEGPAYVLLNKSVAAWAAPRERALMSSLVCVSAPIGALISAPLSVSLLQATGSWRITFVLLGLVSLATIVALAFVYSNDPGDSRFVNAAELNEISNGGQVATDATTLAVDGPAPLFTAPLLLNAIGFFCSLYTTFLVLTWIPKYLQDQHHVTLSAMFYVGMVPWIGACVLVIIGGLMSDRVFAATRSTRLARSWFAAASLAAVSISLFLVPAMPGATLAVLLVALANAINQMPNSAFWIIVVEQSPRHILGRRSGITLLIASASSLISPTVTGYAVQHFGYDAMFYLASAVSACGAIAMFALKTEKNNSAPLHFTSPALKQD